MQENTSKTVCRNLADLLVAHGVEAVFSSPGSRNAPIIVALSSKEELNITPVVDERVAAFMALGYSLISNRPVALVCTSGTALLNFLPAVAESFYRKVPLIVISADRPVEWIDQDDSQTIRQLGVLDNFVKKSYDIDDRDDVSSLWYANRQINDALLLAVNGRKSPVHINIRLCEPLNGLINQKSHERVRVISQITPREDIETALSRQLASDIASPRKIMIIAGFNSPDNTLNKALNKIAALPNFIILTETISNLHGADFISSIDTVLSVMSDDSKRVMAPDVVITLGGALVSRHVKTYIRNSKIKEHWHVGLSHTTIDCFCSLTRRIEMEPAIFFRQLASGLQPHRIPSDYKQKWLEIRDFALKTHDDFSVRAPWSDFKAFAILTELLPRDCNLQISNGTPIRYMQLFAGKRFHRSDCNRGVSGIDGATSTSVGAAMAAPDRLTVLISGDMGAQYDIGALTYAHKIPNFRMVVIMNGGGSIFRFIGSTENLPQMEQYLAINNTFPIKELAEAYGIRYFEAASPQDLNDVFPKFIDRQQKSAALLAIYTPIDDNATILKKYFRRTMINN
ncbi:MAG: 2-succinyl-5-enolpyruvyl-6-hydroxy-3-cyclohexene-1-carboxylic-acid synthase [Paramuribaculum sp.]|nr:2-succinyl-5-enolpyruvyl-6-hydroxy-3-cyclohexene-1-carboxylic-acid synthase [Paramuribaculum sp.]